METQVNLESWSEFNDSEYLEPRRVRDEKHGFAIVNVDINNELKKLILHLESDEGKLKRKFQLNKTNGRFLERQGIMSPKKLIGCVIYFEKIKVANPTTKEIVDALRICKVEQ